MNGFSHANVAELADALDLGSSGATRGGSSPLVRTILISFTAPQSLVGKIRLELPSGRGR